ncbi:hypothetical protein KC845_00875 [Candidatus Kaiserbacteria bacterium]|nr:hypothetical protein [Candidatus Kaiserbacteria bacterium]
MVRLNKSKLSITQLNKLSKQFTQLITSSKEDQTITVFDSLLGKEENRYTIFQAELLFSNSLFCN